MDLGPGWEDALRAWRRLTRRVATDGGSGLDTLADVSVLRRQLEHVELSGVKTARAQGRSWAEIATHLGVTRQSAWERWRDLDEDDESVDLIAAAAVGAVQEVGRSRRGARGSAQVSVPDLIGLACADARHVLMGAGFTPVLHNAGGDLLPLVDAEGTIIDQVPTAGSMRRNGSSVTVWIDRGGEAGVREPRRPRPPVRSARAENAEKTSGEMS